VLEYFEEKDSFKTFEKFMSNNNFLKSPAKSRKFSRLMFGTAARRYEPGSFQLCKKLLSEAIRFHYELLLENIFRYV
jgi:hypothetical protein